MNCVGVLTPEGPIGWHPLPRWQIAFVLVGTPGYRDQIRRVVGEPLAEFRGPVPAPMSQANASGTM